MNNGGKLSRRFKNIITIIVAVAVMIGMIVPTVAMENGDVPAVAEGEAVVASEEVAAEEAAQPEEPRQPEEDGGQQAPPEDEKEAAGEEETAGPEKEPETVQDQEPAAEIAEVSPAQEEETVTEKQNPEDLLTSLLPAAAPQMKSGIITPFDVIDLDETMIYPGVKAVWYNKSGAETNAPAGAAITVTLMDKGPQDSYPDWAPSQNRLGTSVNTVTLKANNPIAPYTD